MRVDVKVTKSGSVIPSRPLISATALGPDTVRITLLIPSSSTAGIEYYRVEYKRAVDPTWTLVSSTVEEADFSYDVSGLTADTAYEFRVGARDPSGVWSDYSQVASATTEDEGSGLNLSVDGYPMPDLDDEIAYYDSLSWSYTVDQLPNFEGSDPNYAPAFGGHLHDTIEGDAVWDNLMMYLRTEDGFYYDRALAWATYQRSALHFELGGLAEALNTTPKGSGNSYGDPGVESHLWNDIRMFSADHMTGWGLIALYVLGGRTDQTLLDRAKQFGEVLTDYVYLDPSEIAANRTRRVARALQMLVPLYRETGDSSYIELINQLVTGWTTGAAAPEDHGNGMKMWWATEAITKDTPDLTNTFGPRDDIAWAYGDRVQSTLVTAILAEGMWRVYLETQNETVKELLVAAARYVMEYAYDPVHGYVGSYFGIYHGHPYHGWADGGFALSTGATDKNACEYMSYRTSTDPLTQSATSKLVVVSTDASDTRAVTFNGSDEHSADHAALQEVINLNGTTEVTGSVDFHRIQTFTAAASSTAVITLKREDDSVVARLGPRLRFDGGSAAFVVGETITGGTSGATAVIEEMLALTGTGWTGNASGYLVISGKSGTFQDNEAITSASGAAVVNGTLEVPTERRLNITIDGAYTLFLTNLSIMGYKLTGEQAFKDFADLLFERGSHLPGNKRGDPLVRTAEDEVNLFIDTSFEGGSSWGGRQANQFHAKGLLQHTYLMFENGGDPDIIGATGELSYLAEQLADMEPGEWRVLDTVGYNGGGILVTLSLGTILEYNRRAFINPWAGEKGQVFTFGTSRSGLRSLAGTYTQSSPLNAFDSDGDATIPGEYTISWSWPTWEIKNGDQPTGQNADYGSERSALVVYDLDSNGFTQHRGTVDNANGSGFNVTPERHAHCRYVSSGTERLPRYMGNHAWDYGGVDRARKKLYFAGHGTELIRYDLENDTWEELDPRSGPSTDKTGAAEFFAEIDRYVRFVLSSTSGVVYPYDPVTDSWEAVSAPFSLPAAGQGYRGSSFAVHNPVHGFVYFSGGSKYPEQLFRLNQDLTATPLDDCPTAMVEGGGLMNADGSGSSQMVDPVTGVLLVAVADGTFWEHDPTAESGSQWTQLTNTTWVGKPVDQNQPLVNTNGNQWAVVTEIRGTDVGLTSSQGGTLWWPGSGSPRPNESNMRPWLYKHG